MPSRQEIVAIIIVNHWRIAGHGFRCIWFSWRNFRQPPQRVEYRRSSPIGLLNSPRRLTSWRSNTDHADRTDPKAGGSQLNATALSVDVVRPWSLWSDDKYLFYSTQLFKRLMDANQHVNIDETFAITQNVIHRPDYRITIVGKCLRPTTSKRPSNQ